MPITHTATSAPIDLTDWNADHTDSASVLAYGATGDGSTDDTTALQAAIDANYGGTIFIPPGTYLSQDLTITDDIDIVGAGWGSILKLKASTDDYLLKFSTASGITVSFRDFAIDGNGSNQSSGGCIYAQGAVQCSFDRLHLYAAHDVCIWLYQVSGGIFGHHNRITRCLFDGLNSVASADQQGIRIQSSDENVIAFCDFENWGGSSPGSEPYAIKDWSGINQIIGNVFVGGQEGVRLQDTSATRIIGNTFDGVGKSGVLASGSKNVIANNLFSDGSSASAGANAQCEIDNSSSAVIVGNSFTVQSTTTVRNCVREYSSSANTLVADNVVDISGSLYGGNPAIEIASSAGTSKAVNNMGWNPVGHLTSPSVPSSTTPYTNALGADCMVLVTGGTVSQIAIAGTNTGQTSGWFRVPAGQTITLTYTGSPTWTWWGD